MSKIMYTSFEQIEADLEILNLEKEINHQKIILGFQKIKEHFTPSGLTKNIFNTFKSIYSGISNTNNTVLSIIIPFVIKWIIDKKRGK
ncbi:DUF6327 family protein [Flavobacterium cellulosilyticum]|uniref:Uncharacterized protein n=1 Tax=Flavobacterium cellulosilyticum TaxID=2541731 RepID=A0A4R5CKE8_9FLAO|nr:DUF6327 family protein [Flavobacterium cellulosilyticum]TDD99649.1 hypothetical protein E0F76_02690 [Flavobacterium cellulosilyticum]